MSSPSDFKFVLKFYQNLRFHNEGLVLNLLVILHLFVECPD